MAETEPKNPNELAEMLTNINTRIENLENQIKAMDRILGTMLPPGARIVTVEGNDQLFIPYEQR